MHGRRSFGTFVIKALQKALKTNHSVLIITSLWSLDSDFESFYCFGEIWLHQKLWCLTRVVEFKKGIVTGVFCSLRMHVLTNGCRRKRSSCARSVIFLLTTSANPTKLLPIALHRDLLVIGGLLSDKNPHVKSSRLQCAAKIRTASLKFQKRQNSKRKN